MANPSLQIGNSNWAIKEDNLLGYSTAGTRFVPQPITMTRESAGTRVNSSGLVETVELLGSEEITCGNFSCAVPLDYWIEGTGWDIANGKASCDGTNISYLTQTGILNTGTSYKVQFDIIDYTSGSVKYRDNGLVSGQSFSGIGSYTDYVVAGGGQFRLMSENFIGSISNISVKEVTRDNVPRIDYTGGGCPHILAEPQRTNLITYSEDLSTYSTVSTTVSTTTETSPIESVTPFLITETATSNQHYIGGNSVSLSGNNTIYCFVKNVSSGRYFKMWGLGLGGANEAVIFDTNTETIYEPSTSTLYVSGSAKLEDYSNGWFRCSITVNTTITNSIAIGLINTVSGFGNDMYLGDITKSVLITGVQLEVGSYPTSYIPTSGSTVTRNQDIFTRDGIGSLINSTEGVLFVEAKVKIDTDFSANCFGISDGTDANRLSIIMYGNINSIRASMNVGGVNQFDFNLSGYSREQYYKIAVLYKANDCRIFINGTKIATNISSTMPPTGTLDRLNFDLGTGLYNFYGKVKQLQVYDTSLSDTQLAALTS